MMRIILLLTFFFQTEELPKHAAFGIYDCDPGNGARRVYEIKADSTFTHLWSDGCVSILVHGRWTVDEDTIVLKGDRENVSAAKASLIDDILDTKVLNDIDGLYILLKTRDGHFIKDKKLTLKTD